MILLQFLWKRDTPDRPTSPLDPPGQTDPPNETHQATRPSKSNRPTKPIRPTRPTKPTILKRPNRPTSPTIKWCEFNIFLETSTSFGQPSSTSNALSKCKNWIPIPSIQNQILILMAMGHLEWLSIKTTYTQKWLPSARNGQQISLVACHLLCNPN